MKMERCLKLCKGIFLALAWIIAQSLSAQTITVSGNVSDVSGEPLIGVTIQVANSSVGTVTNFNGNYTLSGVSPNAVLEVSYVGMTTQRINVNGRTNIDIVMSEDTEILSEVVVTGFGLSQRKESLTSAISVI